MNPRKPTSLHCHQVSILLDVKPWDDETDMTKLEDRGGGIRADGWVGGFDSRGLQNFKASNTNNDEVGSYVEKTDCF